MITVANIRTPEVKIAIKNGDPRYVYCGRANRWYGLAASKWGNPYSQPNAAGESPIVQYRRYLLGRPDLMAALPELKDKVLVCWCFPEPCHCDVLKELAERAIGNDETNRN